MSSAELENLAKIGKLKREPPSARELEGLLKSAQARLADACRGELSFHKEYEGHLERDEKLMTELTAVAARLRAMVEAL